jgi:hypothetical protein
MHTDEQLTIAEAAQRLGVRQAAIKAHLKERKRRYSCRELEAKRAEIVATDLGITAKIAAQAELKRQRRRAQQAVQAERKRETAAFLDELHPDEQAEPVAAQRQDPCVKIFDPHAPNSGGPRMRCHRCGGRSEVLNEYTVQVTPFKLSMITQCRNPFCGISGYVTYALDYELAPSKLATPDQPRLPPAPSTLRRTGAKDAE